MSKIAFALTLVLLLGTGIASAQVPRIISHQGLLTNESGTPVPDGSHSLTVRLYTVENGGDALYEEEQNVFTTAGLFQILIGLNQPLDLAFDQPYWAGFSADGGEEMTPRIPLTSAPYSLTAGGLDAEALSNLPDGSIPPSALDGSDGSDGQVITVNGGVVMWADPPVGGSGDITSVTGGEGIAGGGNSGDVVLSLDLDFTDTRYVNTGEAGSITGDMIPDGSITPDHISTDGGSNGQVLTIEGGSASWADPPGGGGGGDITAVNAGTGMTGGGNTGDVTLNFDTGFGDGRYVEEGQAGSVATAMLQNGAVNDNKLADGSVSTAKLENGAVNNNKLADGSVSTAKLENGAVSTAKLANAAVATNKLANKAVSLAKIDDAGASNGQVIKFTGGSIQWASDNTGGGGLSLPFDGQANASGNPVFEARNTSSSNSSVGVRGVATPTSGGGFSAGVSGVNNSTTGNGIGVSGQQAGSGWGVYGYVAGNGRGVYGRANGTGSGSTGVLGIARGGGVAVRGELNNPTEFGLAGYFDGSVQITGSLIGGIAARKIDHPLDPQNKYLYHSAVESPDMLNVYNGNVMLDANGEAIVDLPDYFESANTDFRYQLTAIGASAPGLFVAEEVTGNQFRIAGGAPGVKVSWQITGVRNDPYARLHRTPVTETKPADRQGLYLYPEAYGATETLSEARTLDVNQDQQIND